LREAIVRAFNLEELEILCAEVEQDLHDDGIELPVTLDVVGGRSEPNKAHNLIGYLDRQGHLAYLVNAVRRVRPGII